VLKIAAAAMVLLSKFAKLSGAPPMVALFDAIGVGQWFRYVAGAPEVVLAHAAVMRLVAGQRSAERQD